MCDKMRISQLSEQAGLPVGTVKFYLRTGLMQHGEMLSATQAEYDESHLARLRLIRALLEVGRLSHAEIQGVIAALDAPDDDLSLSLRAVHGTTSRGVSADDQIDLTDALAFVNGLGWQIEADSPHLAGLARAMAALDNVGLPPTAERLRIYAEAASHVARSDIDWVRETDDERKVLVAATSSVLWEAVLGSMRRLAAENQAARRGVGVPSPRMTVVSP
jgi:DNA-binding transcriptional MerR regulator